MKLLLLILSGYFLYLSSLPCADRQDITAIQERTITSAQGDHNHRHKNDTCPPFCICTCCAAYAVYQQPAKATSVKLFFKSRKHIIANDFFLSQEFSSIWQPPKIAC
jgi:hypothetical protein